MYNLDALLEIREVLKNQLQPAAEQDIWNEIKGLLNRYQNAIPNVSESELCKFRNDWCFDLAEYPLSAIKSACAHWRQNPELVKFPPRGMGDLKPHLEKSLSKYRQTMFNCEKAIATIEKNLSAEASTQKLQVCDDPNK